MIELKFDLKLSKNRGLKRSGGQRGIRTLGRVTPTHP